MPTGKAVVNFGAWPGSDTASVAITGQLLFLSATSKADAILDPISPATADHSQDEHLAADIDIRVDNPIDAVGFTVNLICRGLKHYGSWNIVWIWV